MCVIRYRKMERARAYNSLTTIFGEENNFFLALLFSLYLESIIVKH